MPAGPGAKTVAVLCYLAALSGGLALFVRVSLLGLDQPVPTPRLPEPWLVNLAGLLLFGLQHSGMARESFKQRWTRWMPPYLERSLYAATSGLALLALCLVWQPLPGEELWRGPFWLIAVPLTAGAALALVNTRFDHAGLFGLRQVWQHGRPPEPERLLVLGPYRYVRHPLMACLLVFLWAQPVMTATLAVLSGGLTVYVVIGLVFEERDLLQRFGPAYAAYRRRVPALVPWRSPAPAATYPASALRENEHAAA
jgi:protein-S-isoprenylcysteine O-methyltransferase Ste14